MRRHKRPRARVVVCFTQRTAQRYMAWLATLPITNLSADLYQKLTAGIRIAQLENERNCPARRALQGGT